MMPGMDCPKASVLLKSHDGDPEAHFRQQAPRKTWNTNWEAMIWDVVIRRCILFLSESPQRRRTETRTEYFRFSVQKKLFKARKLEQAHGETYSSRT